MVNGIVKTYKVTLVEADMQKVATKQFAKQLVLGQGQINCKKWQTCNG
jgi:hypothetical protein